MPLKIKKILKYIKDHKLLFTALLLFFITLLAYGKTLQMYFWVDDWGVAYKMRFPEENAGNLGMGAYRYIGTPFIWLYPLLGLSAKAYFAIGLFSYFITSLAVYFFVKELVQKHSVALGAAIIFASGYIGSFAIYRLSNSYQLIGMTLFTLLTGWMLVKHYRTKRSVFYWSALLFYIVTLEFFFLRSHGLVFIILGIALLFGAYKKDWKSLSIFLLKLVPFLAIYYYMYLLDPRVAGASDMLSRAIKTIFVEKNFELLNNFLMSFVRIIIPDPIIKTIYDFTAGLVDKLLTPKTVQGLDLKYLIPTSLLFVILLTPRVISLLKRKKKNAVNLVSAISLIFLFVFNISSIQKSTSLWNPRGEDMFTAMLGGSFIIIATSFALRLRKKEKKNARIILLGMIVVAATITIYFINSPQVSLDSSHRYIPAGLVGTAMIYATIFSRFNKRFLYLLSVGLVSFSLIFLTNKEAAEIVKYQSTPDKQGYELILREVPSVDQNSVFFVEAQDDAIYKDRFLGGIPRLGIPTLFGFHGAVRMPVSYDQLYYWLSTGEANLDSTYTFYFGEDGYKNTTDTFRQLLTLGQRAKALMDWSATTPLLVTREGVLATKTATVAIKEGMVGANPVIEVDVEYDSLVPSVFSFDMTTTPLGPQELSYPYYDLSSRFPHTLDLKQLAQTKPKIAPLSEEQILLALRKEGEHQNFLQTVKVETFTALKTREVGYLTDGRLLDTSWVANSRIWNGGVRPEDIVIDLGQVKPVKELVWLNHHRQNTLTKYIIYFSRDGANWTVVKQVEKGPARKGGEVVIEDLPSFTARYVKLSILDTFGGIGHPPAINEIWVSGIDSQFDSETQKQIIACPFCFVADINTAQAVLNFERQIAQARLWWTTDRNEKYYLPNSSSLPIFMDGKVHRYEVVLPAQGTKYKKIKIDGFPVPVSVSINNASIRSLTLQELEEMGLIHEFADN